MRKFRKAPILADSYQIPRYKYTEKDEAYYDTPDEHGMKKADYCAVYRTKTNTIEVPKQSWLNNDVHLVIKDTDGHEILKDGWYPRTFVNEISRSLPHWGFKDVQRTASDPNVWIVEKDTDDYITVNPRPVESSLDLFGMDDTFFTKEELMEFADEVETAVNKLCKQFHSNIYIKYTGVWIEDDNRTITVEYTSYPDENEYSTSFRVDMRAIRKPNDIFKYVDKVVEDITNTIDSEQEIEGSTRIIASSNIDTLEKIAHDVFNDVAGNRDNITEEMINEAINKYDSSLSDSDRSKVVQLVYENIDSYYNRGPLGELQAQRYGDKILRAYEGRTISKRKDQANGPDGLTTCANAIGLGTFQFLEALEGMCADGRAYESSDSTYHIGQ